MRAECIPRSENARARALNFHSSRHESVCAQQLRYAYKEQRHLSYPRQGKSQASIFSAVHGAAQKQIANDWLAVFHQLAPEQIRELRGQYASWADKN